MRHDAESLFFEALIDSILARDPSGPGPDEPLRGPARPGPTTLPARH